MKRILLVSFLSALALLGFYYLWKVNNPPAIGAWDLVSDKALTVYERNTNSPSEDVELFLQSFVPDSLLKNVRNAKELLVSIHVIGKEEVGTVLYLPGFIYKTESLAPSPSTRPPAERNFEGYKILEIPAPGKKVLSVVTIDRVLVMSSTSFLIEDVIRLARNEERKNFSQNNRSLFQFARMESDGGHIYVNLSQLPKLIDFFSLRKNQRSILDRFARSGVVEIKKLDHSLLFSGFAVDSISGEGSILSLFNQQRPVPFSLQRIMSSRTGLLIHYGISDFTTWLPGRMAFSKSLQKPIADSLNALQKKHGFDATAFYHALGDELGVCQAGVYSGELFIAELKDENQALAELKKLRPNITADSLGSEHYSHYQIQTLSVPSLPSTLFWPMMNRTMNYYLLIDHHLLFAEELEDLKSFIDDLDAENTWGKSIEWNAFLSTSQETNVGIIFDGLNGWPSLKSMVSPRWQSFGDSSHFLNINKGSFQFTRLEKSYYFNGVLEFNPKPSKAAIEKKEKVLEISLEQPLAGPLAVVRNHTTGASELLAQDNGNNLLLFSAKLKELFKTKVDGPIRTEIIQIDYYKNRKLQYLFATTEKIYLIDRLGKMVTGFPKSINSSSPIRFLSVVDYDNTRDYRFLISDKKGKLSVYDRDGTPVNGWKEVELKNDLWVAPRPLRSKGKDYVVAITQEGTVHAYSKQGTPIEGFPVKLNVRPRGNWVLEKSDRGDVITLVSDEGVLIQFDLNGKIVNKHNLVKSSAASGFSLVTTANDRYAISRIDKNKMAILDGRGNVIFEKDNPGSDELFLTYFDAGRSGKLYGFTDPQQEFTYFFDEQGRPVFSRPLENQQKPAISIDKSGAIYFYGVNRNSIQSYRPARIN